MKAHLLDARKDDRGTCYLCRISLEEYVKALRPSYYDYEIQRGIVSNTYLDRLVETILHHRFIPPIVLVADRISRSGATLVVGEFKILDGLQRTLRLHGIRSTIELLLREIDGKVTDFSTMSRVGLSRAYAQQLAEMHSNTSTLSLINEYYVKHGRAKTEELFSKNDQWFSVWSGLSQEDEVRMMLTLNAGHKPVTLRHQLELLFLNLLPVIERRENDLFHLVREREKSATSFSRNRAIGDFHFAHIISSIISFHRGEPVTPTAGLIQEIQSSDEQVEEYAKLLTPRFLGTYIDFLVKLDALISKQYGEVGTRWMGREVSLSGIFGALGAFSYDAISVEDKFTLFLKELRKRTNVLDLVSYEERRNSQDLSKINIGSVNKAAIFDAVTLILSNRTLAKVNWQRLFREA